MVTLAAAHTANAQSISVELAEKTPPVDPGDPTGTMAGPPPTTTTTTTTTTTLPTIPRCPDGVTGATPGTTDGYDYWSFQAPKGICDTGLVNAYGLSALKIYCFENPYVDETLKKLNVWEMATTEEHWIGASLELAPDHPDTCYVCGCFRDQGCFAPGVKITMADGSLRNIEDIRAGDLLRNAKTGAAIAVREVIEGPEPLPLIRFGFDDTTVTTSQAHPVLTVAGLKPAKDLKEGDTIFDLRGNPHPLTILETLPLEEGQRVINVDLNAASSDADERLIVSDGIITGDIVLQAQLKERK